MLKFLRRTEGGKEWDFDFPQPLPMVTPAHYAAIEGSMSERGDWLAEAFFRAVFDGHYEYCEPWDNVRKLHACFKVGDPNQWAAGMNAIIAVINTLPRPCSRSDLKAVFAI